MGVIHDCEHGEDKRYLRCLEKAAALGAAHGDAQIHERLAVHPAGLARGAQENGNVAVIHGPRARPVRDRRPGPDQGSDPPGGEGGLECGLVGAVLRVTFGQLV